MSDPARDIAELHAYDDVDRVLVFAEQLGVAADLLASESLAKTRMALVAVDNLADLLLHRHADRVFASGEGSWWYRRKRYTQQERREIRQDFNRQVTLATRRADAPWGGAVEPIIPEPETAIWRVAHTYRNGVYHEDRHNAALIAPLAALYLDVVGRAFYRAYRPGDGIGVSPARVAELQHFGY
jgi:hypothetical protein